MYSKFGNGVAVLIITFLSGFTSYCANGTELAKNAAQLTVQPATCVTLHEGRTCFTQITLTWSSLTAGDFCIYQKESKEKIRCWKQSNGNSALYEFESTEKLSFILINQNNISVAENIIDVSWVHNATPRKRRWRLF